MTQPPVMDLEALRHALRPQTVTRRLSPRRFAVPGLTPDGHARFNWF